MEQDTNLEKSQVRKIYEARRRSLTPEFRCKSSRAICQKLRSLPEYISATSVAFFIPWGAEPDLRELFPEKRAFFPRFKADLNGYEMVEIIDEKSSFRPGKYGIPEPLPQLERANEEFLKAEVLFLVPAVACDCTGVRLGRGGGYYDRLLRGVKSPIVATIFSCQVASALPRASHDLLMNKIVTEEDIINC